MVFGQWISTTKIDKKNLVTSIFSLCSNRFIRLVSAPLLALPSQKRDCRGHHGHGGALFKKIREKCYKKTVSGDKILLSISYDLTSQTSSNMSLAMVHGLAQRFHFVVRCLMHAQYKVLRIRGHI
jgi:hypothetical protein